MQNEEIQRAARELIAQERQQEQMQEQLKSTITAGETAYGEGWGKALGSLAAYGEVDPDDFAAILGTDAPEKVLHELGTIRPNINA